MVLARNAFGRGLMNLGRVVTSIWASGHSSVPDPNVATALLVEAWEVVADGARIGDDDLGSYLDGVGILIEECVRRRGVMVTTWVLLGIAGRASEVAAGRYTVEAINAWAEKAGVADA